MMDIGSRESAGFSRTYNLGMHPALRNWLLIVLLATSLQIFAQQPSPDSLVIRAKELPKARLWEPYSFQLEAYGGIEPYHWRVVSGTLPPRFRLAESGFVAGEPENSGSFNFSAEVVDNGRPQKRLRQEFVLSTASPLLADWEHKPDVSGTRLSGSIKVSNQSGRDFDLTFIVLAVNDIGRATALGYQHFSLKKDTRELELPFGETLALGNYVVNVDVVGEEPLSRKIFRSRLVSAKQSITQGP
jgi:hypothetical protein